MDKQWRSAFSGSTGKSLNSLHLGSGVTKSTRPRPPDGKRFGGWAARTDQGAQVRSSGPGEKRLWLNLDDGNRNGQKYINWREICFLKFLLTLSGYHWLVK